MKNERKLGVVVSVTIILTAAMTFMATSFFYALVLKVRSTASFPGSEKIFEVLTLLDRHYYYEVDKETLIDSALDHMLESLGDPYTTYMDAEEYEQFMSYITGTYYGIGSVVLWDNEMGAVIIVKPFDGSPAQKAGIEKGDRILKIDGEDVSTTDLDGAVAKMRGEKGTPVRLTVLKANTSEEVEVDVIRDEIHIPSVEHEMKGDIGYIAISTFDPQTGADFKKALVEVVASGAKGVIIDLRDNGGGLVNSVTEVANSLLDSGEMIFYTQNKQGKKIEYKSVGKGVGVPIAVLVNENSASASELLAGALRDNLKAPIIGKNTFGKGVVQGTYPLSDSSVVKLTTEKYFTPNGYDINEKGLEPDYDVELKSTEDEQLQLAIEVLKTKLE